MDSKEKFEHDLKKGKYYENKANLILQKHGFTDIHHIEGHNPYYDMYGTYKNKKVYIEVKYNSKADSFKSFIIELCKKNKNPSGLTITRSHYYVLFSYTSYWIIRTKRLHIIVKKYILTKLREQHNIMSPTPEEYDKYILNECKTYGDYIYMLLDFDTVDQHSIFKGSHTDITTPFIN